MRWITMFLVVGLVSAVPAAEEVLAVPSGDHVVVSIDRIPVRVQLADIEVPQRGDLPRQAQQRVSDLILGQEVQVIHKSEFGVDATGTGRVHIKAGPQHINAILVSEGLARYVPASETPTSYANLVKFAEKDAKEDGRGVWGMPPEQPAAEPGPVLAAVDEPEQPRAQEPAGDVTDTAEVRGAFVAELNGRYYYLADDPRVSSINPRRLIQYRTETAAKRAGKQPAPEQVSVADAGIEEATQLLADGERIYSEAIAAGNTSRRDDLYGEAFVKLTQAMQVWSRLAEQNPGDAEIAENLRRTMQLRYGAMKQRRF